ncbi:ATP-binding cassette domain-containing protein [Paracoccus cavernae]|uniref:hypothetical protein n=1 Tax=Paracoccus cavernae TaxID=1571207 RepID=UPI00362BF44B
MTGLRLSNIGRSYGETKVLTGIDLEIAAGEFVAVLGPSGCKTMRLVAGFDRPDEGTITLGDRLVAGGKVMVSRAARHRYRVSELRALAAYVVAENVGYALKAHAPSVPACACVARQSDGFDGLARGSRCGQQRQRVALALPCRWIGSGAA